MPDPFLSLRQITKRFGAVTAVRDVSLDVGEGEFVCFLGPSGCGKTTLLRIVAGLETPDAGQALLRGADLLRVPARRRKFGMVFQSYSLFPSMTAARNVAYGLECQRRSRSDIDRRVLEMLALVHLEDEAARHPHQLSGGQQQRVALARALAPEPSMLLLDEPLSALDAKVRESLRGEVRDLQRALRITTIMVTHDQDEAMEMADRIVVMNGGAIEQAGSAEELYQRPATRFVAEFIGRMNVLQLDDGSGATPTLAGAPIRLPTAGPGRVRLVGLRPEDVEVAEAGASTDNHVTGIVEKAVYLGSVTHVTLAVGQQHLLMEVRGARRALARGTALTVRLPPEALRPLSEP
ncbi:MAG: ABC transporter ATP-binding protein [Candidatus Rokuibacteriota bacterium]